MHDSGYNLFSDEDKKEHNRRPSWQEEREYSLTYISDSSRKNTIKNGFLVLNEKELKARIEKLREDDRLPKLSKQYDCESFANIIMGVMRFLCQIPVNEKARDKIYTDAKGRAKLHEVLDNNQPMACRELSLLGHAILANYGIPSRYLKGKLYVGSQDFWGSKLARSRMHAVTGVNSETNNDSQSICYLDATTGGIIFGEDDYSKKIGNKIPMVTEEEAQEKKDDWFKLNKGEYEKWRDGALKLPESQLRTALETAEEKNHKEFTSLREGREESKKTCAML
jgi:hypothetical protein